jgi:hypothetical protein
VAVSGPVDCEPLVALVPLQPPEAVHVDEFVEIHVSDVASPLATVAARAVSVTVGADVTATFTVSLVLPPAPEHVSMKLVAALNALVT